MQQLEPRFVCLLAQAVSDRQVWVRDKKALAKGTKVLAIFTPRLCLYPLEREPRSLIERAGTSYRLLEAARAAKVRGYRRTIFTDGRWEIFYTVASQRRVAERMVQLACGLEEIAEALIALERTIRARAFAGELTEEEMTRGWETYKKILARAFNTQYEGEQETALRMALRRAMLLAGIRKEEKKR